MGPGRKTQREVLILHIEIDPGCSLPDDEGGGETGGGMRGSARRCFRVAETKKRIDD